MTFSEQLNEYISLISCSAAELAARSQLSAAAISRYRSGARIPEQDSEAIGNLAQALAAMAAEAGQTITEQEIATALEESAKADVYPDLAEHFDLLISTLHINVNDLAKELNFDASYLSRIRNGRRNPYDKGEFVENTCRYVTRKFTDENAVAAAASLLGCDGESLSTQNRYYTALLQWFGGKLTEQTNHMDEFLKKLDEFNLDEYIRAIHFDELKVPTMPFRLPTSRTYYGLEQMKQGELDFFKATVLARSMEPIFMCSDMQMDDMAKDVAFGKKWMFAIAMSIKKGLHLNIIHNIDRPFNEMLLGLESWIPIYMTGQVSPYHLKNVTTNVYHHLTYVSGAVALSGDCIDGFHAEGKYYLTNNKEEVAFYRTKAKRMLAKAYPLMEIYRENDAPQFQAAIQAAKSEKGSRRNILSVPPVYTMQPQLLQSMFERSGVTKTEQEKILRFAEEQRQLMAAVLQENSVTDEIPCLTKQEFAAKPVVLPLAGMFYEKEIAYTYDEYLAHWEQTREYARQHENYSIVLSGTQAFCNIQIQILENRWALISKSKTPTIHFLIRNAKMVNALQNFIPPITEQV